MGTHEAIQMQTTQPELPQTPEEVAQRMSSAYDKAIKVAVGNGTQIGNLEEVAILAVRLYDTSLGEEDMQRMSNALQVASSIDENWSHTQRAILAVKVYDELERLQYEATQ